MAPRRNVKITASENKVQAVPENHPRTRVRKTQVLKVPSITTITIPNNKSNLDVPDTLRKVDIKTKIALADEVARSQILKVPVAIRLDPPKKRGRKKVVISEFFTPEDIKEEPETIPKADTNFEKVNKKHAVKNSPIKRLEGETILTTETDVNNIIKKPPVKNPPAKRVVTRKRYADTTIKKPRIKRQRLIPKPIPDNQEKVQKDTIEQETYSKTDTTKETSSPIMIPKEQNIPTSDSRVSENTIDNTPDVNSHLTCPSIASTPKIRKRLTRGKQAKSMLPEKTLQPISELSCLKSPVPLTPCIDSVKPEAPNIKSPKPQSVPRKSPKPQSVPKKSPKPQSVPKKLPKSHCLPKKPPKNRLQALRVRAPKPTVKPRKKPDTSKAKNAILVGNRQNSTSSISNLSWTRDISSSSTTTCVTVSSKDVVCIDNKLPFIKLTNIDNDIDKYKPVPTVSDEDSSSDDSSSSDSFTSSEEQLSNSKHSPSGCTSPVKVNSLNLSYSSCNSIEERIKDKHLSKPDYEKAADKLIHALKKIDMEFVNWVHDTECVASDLDRIKDNLFTILKNEFCALKHCQNLQEMSNSDKIESPTNEPQIVVKHHTESNRLENDKIENKNVELTVQSPGIETNRIELNEVESSTVDRNLVGSQKTDNMHISNKLITGNNIETDTIVNTLFKSSHLSKCNGETSSPRSNRNESDTVANNKAIVEADHIISNTVDNKPEEIFIKPGTSGYVLNNSKTRSRRVSESDDSSSENEDYRNNYTSAHDDDDALSLFAESITGIESSKYTSVVSTPVEKQFEEYIPKPIQNKFVSPPNYYYNPTKIADQVKNGIVKTVCEKQNADSTSIYKESNVPPPEYKESSSQPDSIENNQEVIEKPVTVEGNIVRNLNKPCLIGHLYTIRPKDTIAIIKGYCFYNLVHKCTHALYGQCRFSHKIPDDKEVTAKMDRLSNEGLIKDYMLIRRHKYIMRRYGMCVLFECVRRQLTRVVVEIAYDFIMKCDKGVQIDETLRVAATEIALLHLNNIDLSVCEDLLKLKVSNTSLLCEDFMQTMTSTQNFARFKSVFLSLTYFMVNNDRTFDLKVVEHLLERVCILPFDEPVVRALIQIMRLTKPEIFLNSKIDHFEKQIRSNAEVYCEYMTLKGAVNFEMLARRMAEQRSPALVSVQPVLPQPVEQPLLVQPASKPLLLQPASQPLLLQPSSQPFMLQPVPKPLLLQTVDKPLNVRPEMIERVPLPPSPDTTHLDNMNKMAENTVVPKITRTIQGYSFTPSPQMAGTFNNEEIIQTPNHKNWRHRSIFPKFGRGNFSSPRQIMRPRGSLSRPHGVMRQQQFNQRLVTLGESHVMYPPPEPDF